MSGFVKATKSQAKARIAFSGPPGSGKTYTALQWAHALGEKVALIDTERGSASLYADVFDFDTLDMAPPYHPERLIEALRDAASYDVTIIDSLSHFWAGEGGVLEIVDRAKSGADSFRAWSKGTPIQQRMVDALLRHPGHVIVTMRAKTEYALVQENGKNRVEKLGLAPVQRDGIEYEWTITMDVDMRHVAHVGKSRYSGLADLDIAPDQSLPAARDFAQWLTVGKAPEPAASLADIDALKERLGELPGDVADAVRREWASRKLPGLAHLRTQGELDQITAMVDHVEQSVTGEAVPA